MNWFTGKKILVPIDFGEDSRRAVDTALEIATSPADVCAIYVATDLAVTSPEVIWDVQTDEIRSTNIEKNFHKEFAAEKYRAIQFFVAFGDPGHGIADYAALIAIDLIVMPSHGRTGLQRLLIGSVTERVMRLAHCPVLVLRN